MVHAVSSARDDHVAARQALLEAAERSRTLLLSAGDGRTTIPRSQWTVADAGAHLLVGLRSFTAGLDGVPGWESPAPHAATFQERLTAFTARTLEDEPQRDLPTIGDLVVSGTSAFLDASAGRAPDDRVDTPWYGDGATLSLTAATCLLLAEQVVHGYDVAQAIGAAWPISRRDACLIFTAVQSMMPMIVNPDAARGVTATYDIRLRGGRPFVVHVEDGAVRVEASTTGTVDCHLSADPAAFLLVGYGRINQWHAIGRGQLATWGRRPWLALRLKGLFFNP